MFNLSPEDLKFFIGFVVFGTCILLGLLTLMKRSAEAEADEKFNAKINDKLKDHKPRTLNEYAVKEGVKKGTIVWK